MKPRMRLLEARLKKLEIGNLPVPSYVVTLTHDEWILPDVDKRRIIAKRSGGRPVAVMPTKCTDGQEWISIYAKRELARAKH